MPALDLLRWRAEQPRELAHVVERLDLPDEIDDPSSRRRIDAAPLRALEEFPLELAVAHRIDRAALAEVGPSLETRAGGELDLDDRRHLVEPGSLGFRMHAEIDFAQQLLHVRPVDDF